MEKKTKLALSHFSVHAELCKLNSVDVGCV